MGAKSKVGDRYKWAGGLGPRYGDGSNVGDR